MFFLPHCIYLYLSIYIYIYIYYWILFTNFQHKKWCSFQHLSLEFILKIFLKFCKFPHQYSYKMYCNIKECITIKALFSLHHNLPIRMAFGFFHPKVVMQYSTLAVTKRRSALTFIIFSKHMTSLVPILFIFILSCARPKRPFIVDNKHKMNSSAS